MSEYTEWLEEKIIRLDYELEQSKAQELHHEVFQGMKVKLQKYSGAWDVLIEYERTRQGIKSVV